MTGGFDPTMPNAARVYSRLLGGKDHFPSDQAEADLLLEIYPPLAEMVQENRAFIAEPVTWAASGGIGQFIDLGAGLPVSPAVQTYCWMIRCSSRRSRRISIRCQSGRLRRSSVTCG